MKYWPVYMLCHSQTGIHAPSPLIESLSDHPYRRLNLIKTITILFHIFNISNITIPGNSIKRMVFQIVILLKRINVLIIVNLYLVNT